jgi:hypothetical protein
MGLDRDGKEGIIEEFISQTSILLSERGYHGWRNFFPDVMYGVYGVLRSQYDPRTLERRIGVCRQITGIWLAECKNNGLLPLSNKGYEDFGFYITLAERLNIVLQ